MLKGKTALITGASRGIGRAIALELASQGANIVVNYAGNVEKAQETVEACETLGVTAILAQGDVSSSVEVEKVMKIATDQFKQVDILINNAGITRDGLMLRMSEEDFDSVVDTNLKGAFLFTKAVTRSMMKQRWGRIVNLSSVVGVLGQAGQVNYGASKAGIIGLTKSAARELAARNITVNAVAPGFIQTDMTAALTLEQQEQIGKNIPLERLGSPEDVAKVVGFLVGEGGSYLTGQVISVDGGLAM